MCAGGPSAFFLHVLPGDLSGVREGGTQFLTEAAQVSGGDIPGSPGPGCVTSGELLNLSVPCSHICKPGVMEQQ